MKPHTFTTRACLGLVLLFLLGGCAIFGVSSEPEEHTVESGDTLYSIAWQNDLDIQELAAWNGIKPPYVIRKGQRLLLEPPDNFVYAPSGSGQESKPAEEPAAVSTTPLPSEESVDVRPADEPIAAPLPPVVATAPLPSAVKWRWPAEGELLAAEAASGGAGIDIAGRLGQPVRAAAGGKVVYSGGGLQGYGQLVIVKHSDNYLSAYGYNRRLLVRQGDEVHTGQMIAEMGEGPQRRPVLHFEIRRGGKSLNPLQMLPAR
jgi:lipoprotein NlpD